MKHANLMITAFSYFLMVVLSEVGLYFLALSMPEISGYSMILVIAIFLVVAWVLKLKIPAAITAVILIALYGVLSFYSDFPAYYVGYPETIEEFLSVIAIKTGYYTFPLVAYVAISRK